MADEDNPLDRAGFIGVPGPTRSASDHRAPSAVGVNRQTIDPMPKLGGLIVEFWMPSLPSQCREVGRVEGPKRFTATRGSTSTPISSARWPNTGPGRSMSDSTLTTAMCSGVSSLRARM